jgi:eukaryotic-like serine/threonine-protein kinase
MIGKTLGHYEISTKIGEGGMGVVYLAHDTSLNRQVAIKLLPEFLSQDIAARKRFVREARSAAALDHPFICAIHEVGETEGKSFIVMEYLEGQTLRDRLAQRAVPLKQAMQWAVEIAEALAVAHEKGIIHRDLKPANIMLLRTGHTKVMDFGLAKQVSVLPESGSQEVTLTGSLTKEGMTLGTLPYMSPEQVQGKTVDFRSDLFSFSIVIYEMLTGVNPFKRDSGFDTAEAILREVPAPISKYRDDAPQPLAVLIDKLLAKDPKDRCQQAREVTDNLQKAVDETFGKQIVITQPAFAKVRKVLKRPVYLIPLILVLAGAAYFSVRGVRAYQKGRWAREEAPNEVVRLIGQGRSVVAARLLKEAMRYAPESKELDSLKIEFLGNVSIKTTPPGADVYIRDYADTEDNGPSHWEMLGRSPLAAQIPIGYHRFRIVKEGFEPVELAAVGNQIRLHRLGEIPPKMLWVPRIRKGGASPAVAPADAEEYWIDKYEVTNRQFKEFVDAGGYQKQEYWKETFIKDGKQLSWDEAMGLFRDPAGRPGPAIWEFGTYPEEKADYPVGGVSWYEAAAYAEFAGKSLPTIYHWCRVSGMQNTFGDIVRFSNFSTKGLAQVGAYRGLGDFGTYDMAGNIKEWCWNQTGNSRYAMGGAWNESTDTFSLSDARPPFDRSAHLGFRCVKYITPPPKAFSEPVPSIGALCSDRRKNAPADDQAFKVYLNLHSYAKTDLKAKFESVDEMSSQYWRKEKVSFQAAYGKERVIADLYLPKNAAPGYQIVLFFPGSPGLTEKVLDPYEFRLVELILRSERAVMLPSYKGYLERGPTPNGYLDRELTLHWSKDLGRSIDYLETRSDIDIGKLAYLGYSLGAWQGPRLVAVEPRIKAAVLAATCSGNPVSPEVDPWNFVPRVKIPVLVLSGRNDFICPLETSVIPLFDLLGTPKKDKLQRIYESGHAIFYQPEVFKDMFDWLDRYLGPVRMKPTR